MHGGRFDKDSEVYFFEDGRVCFFGADCGVVGDSYSYFRLYSVELQQFIPE